MSAFANRHSLSLWIRSCWMSALGLVLSMPAWGQELAPIRAERLQRDEVLSLDGSLDHPAWRRATAFTDFTEKEPRAGVRSRYETRVRVLFNDQAIFVGVEAPDPAPDEIRAPMMRHDNVFRTQDSVSVYFDTAGTRRAAQFFRVNAAGSTADGIYGAADDNEDLSPDFDFDAAALRRREGYTVVFRIPFASLRYSSEAARTWQIMVTRRVPREQFHLLASVPIPADAANFLVAMQPLQGIELPKDSWFLSVRPSLTAHANQKRRGSDPAEADNGMSVALDVKFRPRPELLVDATLNPDFSQIALDVPQLAGNTRFALSLQEKRPFFFESSDLLRSPTDAVYTRSITQPRWGVRSTWRGERVAGTAFLVQDKGGGQTLIPNAYGTDVAEQPASTVLVMRGQAEAAGVQWAGTLGGKRYGEGRGDSIVAGPDFLWSIGDTTQARGQWLHSSTTALPDANGKLLHGATQEGDRLRLAVTRQTERTQTELTLDRISPRFRDDAGFVAQSGIQSLEGRQALGWRDLSVVNEFWANLWFKQVRDLDTGVTVQQYMTPGFWLSAPRNTQWTLQYRGPVQRMRTSASAPLLSESYWYSEFETTPARWMPSLYLELSVGRMADVVANKVRPGGSLIWRVRLRPMDRLELEPSMSYAWLRNNTVLAYRESAVNALAIWHFDAQRSLRAIYQQTAFDRRADGDIAAERSSRHVLSLTYAWRRSAGTMLYLGASSSRSESSAVTQRTEGFIKLQVDVDEFRGKL